MSLFSKKYKLNFLSIYFLYIFMFFYAFMFSIFFAQYEKLFIKNLGIVSEAAKKNMKNKMYLERKKV